MDLRRVNDDLVAGQCFRCRPCYLRISAATSGLFAVYMSKRPSAAAFQRIPIVYSPRAMYGDVVYFFGLGATTSQSSRHGHREHYPQTYMRSAHFAIHLVRCTTKRMVLSRFMKCRRRNRRPCTGSERFARAAPAEFYSNGIRTISRHKNTTNMAIHTVFGLRCPTMTMRWRQPAKNTNTGVSCVVIGGRRKNGFCRCGS